MKRVLRAALAVIFMFVFNSAQADDNWTNYTDVTGTTKLGLQTKIANREQLTDVPTIYLDIPDVKTINSDLTKEIDPATGDVKYHKATIQVVDNSDASSAQHLESFIDSELEIKVRGNSTSSAGNGKRPYRLKFASKKTASDGVAHKHDLLGLGYEKRNWTLLANAFDMSMIRNAVTYHLGKYVGMDFCPGYKFVDLVINDDYRGTYQVSDQVEVDAYRVNIEDTDWFLEGVAWNNMVEQPATSSGEPFMCIKNPEPETDEELSALISEVETWRSAWLASFDSQNSKTGWPATNNVESLIKYYTAINITGDIDGWFVFKGYRTPTGPFTWGPLWDKDLAYGNWGQADPNKLVEYYSKCNFEWKIQGLLSQPLFVNQAKAFIDELIDKNLYSKLEADIDRIASQLQQTQALNYQLYNIKETGSGSVVRDTYEEYIQQLKDFLQARIPFVQSALADKIEALPAPEEAVYNPENAWWSTGLRQNKEYNMSVSNRTLKGGEWNTFCLPFDATETQMKSSLGCNYELKVHTGMDSDGKTMLFSSPASLDIEAGVPYLIKPTNDVNTFGNFNSVYYTVNVTNSSQNAYNGEGVTFDNKHYFYASLFHGYELKTATDYLFSNDVYTDNTSLIKTTTNNQNGCRAFIRVPEGETAAIKMGEVVIEDLTFNVNDGDASADKVGGTYNITLANRGNLYADGWCTICLPFTITKKNFEAKIGYGTKLRGLASIQGTSFNFDKVDDKTLHAGVPYLIMIDNTDTNITKDLGTVTFNNVKLETTEGASVSPKDGYAFVGILSSKQLAADGTQLFMGANNELYKPSSTSGKLGGGKAYFQIPGKASAGNAKVNVIIDGIETTMVEQVVTDFSTSHQDIYNLNGQKMNGNSLKSLPRGIYIINGKKITK